MKKRVKMIFGILIAFFVYLLMGWIFYGIFELLLPLFDPGYRWVLFTLIFPLFAIGLIIALKCVSLLINKIWKKFIESE